MKENLLIMRLEIFFIFISVIFYCFVFPHGIHGDASVRYEAMQFLLKTGSITEMVYSYVGPLFSTPLFFLGKIVKSEYWWVSRFNTFLYIGLVYFFYKKGKATFGASAARKLVLLLCVATMFPRHTADYYGEVFSTACMALAIWWISSEKWHRGAFIWLLSVLNTPASLIGASFISAWVFFQKRKLLFGILPLLGFLGIFLETYIRFGDFFPHQYMATAGYKTILPYSDRPGFGYPMFFGIISILFSYGKGLIFFTPGILLLFFPSAFPKKWSTFMQWGGLYLIGLVLVYSKWWDWTGNWFWGPRFFLFASLLSVFGIFSLWIREVRSLKINALLLFLITLSVWVSCQGIMFGNDDLEFCSIEGGRLFFMCYYVPELSALWRAFVVENRGVNGKQMAYFIFHFLGYILLTHFLWREIFQQSKKEIQKLFLHAMQFKEWKW